MNRKVAISFVIAMALLVSCGGRIPKGKTAGNIIKGYFQKYGKKYKETDFGRSRVEGVDVAEVQEIHKNMIAATAFVKLRDGSVWSVRCVLEKKTLGWRFVSWEKL
jgi:hypothetical protein